MPGRALAEAAAIAERFRAFVGARNVRSRDQQRDVGRITLSIGVAELGPDEGTLRLIDRADRALYRAKSEGRNRVVTDLMETRSDVA